MFQKTILFSRLMFPDIGGMESHQAALSHMCPIQVAIEGGYHILYHGTDFSTPSLPLFLDRLEDFTMRLQITVFFFNDLGFITIIEDLKARFSHVQFIMRSGGNDILRAPVGDDSIDLSRRQSFICKTINHYIDNLIVNSDYSYLRLIKLGILPSLMKKVRGGVGDINPSDHSTSKERDAFRRRYGIGERTLLLFVCRMKRFKGINEFLDDFASYPYRKDFYLVFAGDGEMLQSIRQAVLANGLDSQCAFLGKLSYQDSVHLISFADYLVNPSIEEERFYGDKSYIHTETMGRSMMEAVSQKVPIIATDVGGTRELFYECENVGYLIGKPYGIHEILDRIRMEQHPFHPIACDYSWKNVFDKYRLLMNPPDKNVLVLDLDDTLIRTGEDIESIVYLLNQKRSRFHLIINSARKYDQDLKALSDRLGADYCIANNGSYIYTQKKTMWNDKSFLYDEIIQDTDKVYRLLKISFHDCVVKKTHEHIIQLRFNKAIGSEELKRLETILSGTSFEYIFNSNLMKVYPKYMSKASAFQFVLKDLFFNKIYGAGNSLNDCLFLRLTDHAWLSDNLKGVDLGSAVVTYFHDDEAGIRLLSNILKEL